MRKQKQLSAFKLGPPNNVLLYQLADSQPEQACHYKFQEPDHEPILTKGNAKMKSLTPGVSNINR